MSEIILIFYYPTGSKSVTDEVIDEYFLTIWLTDWHKNVIKDISIGTCGVRRHKKLRYENIVESFLGGVILLSLLNM